MKKKKPRDKTRHKNKLRKNQTAAQQENDRVRNESLDKMKRRLAEITGTEHKIIRNASSESMSEALLEFAEPFMDSIDTNDIEAFEKAVMMAVMMAVMLWNCAILQEEKGKDKEVAEMLKPLMQDDDGKAIVRFMLSRKKEMFPGIKRYIVDYELTDKGDEFHLSVASTIQK